ncbi:MAG: hypothetical protein EOO50_03705 [Flavobacterium sp.]|uniref:DUF6327 family protein n=1 Tax=Flavobacterium sp. TaxID=239 RepID=UPI00122B964A|nr:DUF6327 family protein [Flavobacterium sp.]RZJ67940.1 MAG: hypothetical protein EOO50_03705 [Flavobacterium sp.]
MENKKYASYAEIERDLEILKLEKEIHYQKLIKNFDDTKESFDPKKMFGGIPEVAIDVVSGFAGPLKGMAINFILKKIFK